MGIVGRAVISTILFMLVLMTGCTQSAVTGASAPTDITRHDGQSPVQPGANDGQDRVFSAADVRVVNPWVRLLPPTVNSTALYFELTNLGAHDIAIDRVEIEWARHVELHETIHKQDLVQMVPLTDKQIPAGKSVLFESGGKHVMVMGLKEPLNESQTMPVTLHYLIQTHTSESPKAGVVSFDALVKRLH